MRFLEEITDFIFVRDEPCPADAIVVPGNVYPEPAGEAARLYRAGFADRVYASGRFSKGLTAFPGPASKQDLYPGPYRTEAEMIRDVLIKGGVPEDRIALDEEASFTLENAENVRRLMEAAGPMPGRVILCCQAFHARRCRMYFEYVFRDTGTAFLVCPAVTQGISRDNWRQSQRGIDLVMGELARCGEQFGWMLRPEMTAEDGKAHDR